MQAKLQAPPSSTNNLQPTRTSHTRPISSCRISQPVARRMPRNSGNTRIDTPTCRNSVNTLSRLSVEDLKTIPPTADLVAGAADKAAVEAPADAADGAAVVGGDGAAADPVRGVPEGDEGVAAADGEVAACGGVGDGEAGGGVGVEGVEDVEGGVGEDLDGAFAGCGKEVEVGGGGGIGDVVGEGGCVCLDGLGVGFEGFVGRCVGG